MQLLRKKRFARIIAIFLMLLFVNSTFYPTVSWALTHGPHQPEYTSYEESGATDLVNLLTGDFAFTLPLLEVPGPDGGFSLPLAYHAGIGLEQEASWMGLGWSMNPGAITRNIIEFPDDAAGETQEVRVQDLTGVRGWTSSALGLGQMGWNNVQGHYGVIDILGGGFSYDDNGLTSKATGFPGLGVHKSGLKFDVESFAMTLTEVAMIAATTGTGTAAVQVGKAIAMELATRALVSSIVSVPTPNSPAAGHWEYSKRNQQKFLHKNYWIWLDQTRIEQMYGTLNFDKTNLVNYAGSSDELELQLKKKGVSEVLKEFRKESHTYNMGAASDVSYYVDEDKGYHESFSPVSIASDIYNVRGPGISGSITPYRLDIGSVATPREMTENHRRLAPVNFLDYKVPFLYEGSFSNNYYHHIGGNTAVDPNVYSFGITEQQSNTNPSLNTSMTYNFDDIIFKNQRMRSDVATHKRIPQANHVEWFTNQEITTDTPYKLGFIDILEGDARTQFRNFFDFGTSYLYSSSQNFTDGKINLDAASLSKLSVGQRIKLILNTRHADGTSTGNELTFTNVQILSINTAAGYLIVETVDLSINANAVDIKVELNAEKQSQSIGGYSITGVDGMTYHYALPSYEHDQVLVIKDKNDPGKNTKITKKPPFANTWLLTAITGPDYVDRGGIGNSGNGIIDENDWGYWVKLNYGHYSNDYVWREPFSEEKLTLDGNNKVSSQGKKQLYFLNSIETRSHIALFIKDNRLDGKSATLQSNLKLDEIIVLSQRDYKNLVTPINVGGLGLTTCSGTINKLWMKSEFGLNSAPRTFVDQKAFKRFKFNHTYELCPGTPNSDAGKLTLRSIEFLGRNGMKIIPDYKFEYAGNYSYHKDKWDGWGAYKSGGNANVDSHGASNNNSDGYAWSLNKIISPLGSWIEINYERDDYVAIPGNPTAFTTGFSDYFWGDGISVADVSKFYAGQPLTIQGNIDYSCDSNPGPFREPFTLNTQVTAVNINPKWIKVQHNLYPPCPDHLSYTIEGLINGSFDPTVVRKGGNIRVASLVTKDTEGNQNKTRYIYTLDGNPGSRTSGAVAQEPDFIKTQDNPATKIPGYPFTPVMYGKVTVLNGTLSSDNDFHTKQVYSFETPHPSHLSQVEKHSTGPSEVLIRDHFQTPEVVIMTKEYFKRVGYEINDYTSKIGRLNEVQTYNRNNELVASSILHYSNDPLNNKQGLFTEGTIVTERIKESPNIHKFYHKMVRTTIKKHPNVLVKTVSTKDGMTSQVEYKNWDFLSSLPTEVINTSPSGIKTKLVTVPAYTKYPEMGPKSNNINSNLHKNMLSQTAAQYAYQLDNAGNTTGLLGASAQLWNKNWTTYRNLNETTGEYVDGALASAQVWRKGASYVYKGTYAGMNAKGSQNFTAADLFNFATPTSNPKWQYLGEINRFDNFSLPIESKDLNGLYSAVKTDSYKTQKVADAGNARYTEMAFSGAETQPYITSGNVVYLDGEVKIGNINQLSADKAHTGGKSLKIAASLEKGFQFITKSDTPIPGFTPKNFRTSVWIHQDNYTQAELYCIATKTDNTTVTLTSTTQSAPYKKAGQWYQLNMDIDAAALTGVKKMEVGVRKKSGTSGIVYVDDFRFQPADAGMNAYVYNEFGELTHVLNNLNLFTRYHYNDAGRLTETYVETFKYGVQLVSRNSQDYKGFYEQ